MAVNGLAADALATAPHPSDVADRFATWAERLTPLTPIAHNWACDCGFLDAWLGVDLRRMLFDPRARDTMALAAAINDEWAARGLKPPFHSLGLGYLCAKFGIRQAAAHDAFSDAVSTARLYARLIGNEKVTN